MTVIVVQPVTDSSGTRLVLRDGDLALAVELGPAECIAIAGDLIEAARRRLGRAEWPPKPEVGREPAER